VITGREVPPPLDPDRPSSCRGRPRGGVRRQAAGPVPGGRARLRRRPVRRWWGVQVLGSLGIQRASRQAPARTGQPPRAGPALALFVTPGVPPADALRRGTTTAMEWLGEDLAATPASVVTHVANPRDVPEVLQSPAAVVLGGLVSAVSASNGRTPGQALGTWWEQSGASDALHSGACGRAVTRGASAHGAMSGCSGPWPREQPGLWRTDFLGNFSLAAGRVDASARSCPESFAT